MTFAEIQKPVLFFDGVCNLCNGIVQFIVRHDKKGELLFASLQSRIGKEAVNEAARQTGKLEDSVILYHKGKFYTKSAAALHTLRLMGGAWSLLYVSFIVPAFIRNEVYDWISRNRYRWFGKKNECMLPTPELKNRFLSE